MVISAPAALPINRLSPFLLQVGASFARTTLVTLDSSRRPQVSPVSLAESRKDIKSRVAGLLFSCGSCFQLLQQHALPLSLRSAALGASLRSSAVSCILGLPLCWLSYRARRSTAGRFFLCRRSQVLFKPTVVSTNNSHQPTAPKLHLLRRLLEKLGITSTSAICHLDHFDRRPTLKRVACSRSTSLHL